MVASGFDRARALERLGEETFDVLVVGGGVTGAGVAVDAATRGLKTALVERRDFAYGTSSRSSKMVHGGIRYLQQGDVKLVWEALTERRRLLRNAPHLVRPLAFLLPIYRTGGLVPRIWSRALGLVLWLYDLVGGALVVGRHQRLDREATLARMPTLKGDQIASAYLYYDARADDARLTLTLVRTAADHGAVVANHAPVIAFLKDDDGRTVGARIDAGGGPIDVRATTVVNAAGVWADDVDRLDVASLPATLRPARGVHVVVPSSLVRNDVAVILPVPGQRSSVFAVPWGDGFTYVGTTDTDYSGSLDDPWCNADDLAYLVASLNHSMVAQLTPDDVVGSWAGLRPLLAGKQDKTADLSRRHRVSRSASGIVSVTGGKLTTYRDMAQDTVDEVLRGMGRQARCRTASLALHGAKGHDRVDGGGLDDAVRDHLVGRYGADARTVIDLIESDPDLGQPLVHGLPYLRAEAAYAAEHEMVVTLDDILSHRTRARLLARDASAEAAESVAALVAGALGWSAADQAREVERYRASVAEERAAAQAPAAVRAAAGGDDGAPATGAGPGWVPSVRLPRSMTP